MTANDWNELANQWQALAMQWAHFWTKSADTPSAVSALEIGNAAIAPPIPPPAWIDPVAASELTERYGRKVEALWQRALANGNGMPPDVPAPPSDRRFSASEWREHPYFAWLKAFRISWPMLSAAASP